MNLKRLIRHVFASEFAVRRAFPPGALDAIERTITACEQRHGGEIRFTIEGALSASAICSGMTPRERALQVFAQLGVWDTAANNGVLIYLLFADRDIEIIADRGLNDRIDSRQWAAICQRMEQQLAAGNTGDACIEAIEAVSKLLAKHFPARDRDEQPNRPVLL
jgi:hypothetical protein